MNDTLAPIVSHITHDTAHGGLNHTCAVHYLASDDPCHEGCRTFCGQRVPCDDEPFISGESLPNDCIVCDTMCDARMGIVR